MEPGETGALRGPPLRRRTRRVPGWKWESDVFVTQFSLPYPGSPLTLFFQSQTQVLLGEEHTGAQ